MTVVEVPPLQLIPQLDCTSTSSDLSMPYLQRIKDVEPLFGKIGIPTLMSPFA